MSIRIDSDKLSGAAASQSSQTDQVRAGGSRFSLTSGGMRGDSVQISSMAGGIADASAAQNAQSAERVRQLGLLYAAGKYQVDSQQLSRAMVSKAITNPGSEIE